MRRYSAPWVRRDYTDLLVILGPTMREVEHFYEEMRRRSPEFLIGYSVYLATPDSRLEGLRVREFYVTPRAHTNPRWRRAVDTLMLSKMVTAPCASS